VKRRWRNYAWRCNASMARPKPVGSKCVWLRIKHDLSTDAVAKATSLGVSQVWRIWLQYFRGSLAAITQPKRGCRHEHLTVQEEKDFFGGTGRAGQEKGCFDGAENQGKLREKGGAGSVRIDGLPDAPAPPVEAGFDASRSSQGGSRRPGGVQKNSRRRWPPPGGPGPV
jgi:hypothetical protein